MNDRVRSKRIAEMTGLSIRQVQVLADGGLIPGAARLGKRWTFDPLKVRRWIEQKEREAECRRETSTSARARGTRASKYEGATTDEAYELALKS